TQVSQPTVRSQEPDTAIGLHPAAPSPATAPTQPKWPVRGSPRTGQYPDPPCPEPSAGRDPLPVLRDLDLTPSAPARGRVDPVVSGLRVPGRPDGERDPGSQTEPRCHVPRLDP